VIGIAIDWLVLIVASVLLSVLFRRIVCSFRVARGYV
jgi:hypothetical protein